MSTMRRRASPFSTGASKTVTVALLGSGGLVPILMFDESQLDTIRRAELCVTPPGVRIGCATYGFSLAPIPITASKRLLVPRGASTSVAQTRKKVKNGAPAFG